MKAYHKNFWNINFRAKKWFSSINIKEVLCLTIVSSLDKILLLAGEIFVSIPSMTGRRFRDGLLWFKWTIIESLRLAEFIWRESDVMAAAWEASLVIKFPVTLLFGKHIANTITNVSKANIAKPEHEWMNCFCAEKFENVKLKECCKI